MSDLVALTEAEFDAVIVSSAEPVLVDFWAEWCAPCGALELVLSEVARELGASVRICRVDSLKFPVLAERMGVKSVPTMFVFSGGHVVKRMFGFKNKRQVIQALTDAL